VRPRDGRALRIVGNRADAEEVVQRVDGEPDAPETNREPVDLRASRLDPHTRGVSVHAGPGTGGANVLIPLIAAAITRFGKAHAQGEASRGVVMNRRAPRAVSLSRVLVGGLMAVVIAALSSGCREATQAAAEAPPAVEIEPVTEQSLRLQHRQAAQSLRADLKAMPRKTSGSLNTLLRPANRQ